MRSPETLTSQGLAPHLARGRTRHTSSGATPLHHPCARAISSGCVAFAPKQHAADGLTVAVKIRRLDPSVRQEIVARFLRDDLAAVERVDKPDALI
eukprot:CAMPEP_0119334140 /NCGR_PEP_ID=MMETSP1333-20130426/86693_1 /TAXON_ID=418940 /ORGANISM="Scyphosphaera apsteinii, Strain RCC1455" /LENGTH=95 /DNA_ID=CAMNT_0007344371 /DNA_START=203 /DNA_END=491 /DNA_ORIENTATION=+